MRRIKKLLALTVMLGALSSLFCADVIVLMDASGTILPWFDQINNRILPDVTRKFVRQGDTFHLVSFNSRVNLEIVQPVHTESDVSRIVSRFLLLYPLGQNSDFLSGLQYTWQYASSLDQQQKKIVIIVSDGIFNPPASSPYANFTNEQVKSELSQISRKIRGAGWNVYYIKLPFPESATIRTLDGELLSGIAAKGTDGSSSVSADGSPSTTGTTEYYDVSTEFTDSLNIPKSEVSGSDIPIDFVDTVFSMPEVVFPEDLGKEGRFFTLPLKVRNTSSEQVNLELTGVLWNNVDILEKKTFLSLSPGSRGTLRAPITLSESLTPGDYSMPLVLRFSDNMRVMPQSGVVRISLTAFSLTSFLRTGGFIAYAAILVFVALLLILAVFVIIARRTASPAAEAVRKASPLPLREGERKEALAFPGNEADTAGRRSSILGAYGSAGTDKGIAYNAEKQDKQIRWDSGDRQDKKIAYNASTAVDSEKSVMDMSERMAEERKSRFALLSSAADKGRKAATHGRKGASSSEAIIVRDSNRVMLELFVYNQNTFIGKRNVHVMKAGTRLSIGGGISSFLVFLVKFPGNIAEVRFDGVQCDLAILKPEYFPYEEELVVRNCIGRDFTIVSDKEYEVRFQLREYEDPVAKLNRLLTSIEYR